MIKSWFLKLNPRERIIVSGGGLIVALLLGYLFIWNPIITTRNELRQQAQEKQALIEWMRMATENIQQLRQTSKSKPKVTTQQSLAALLNDSLNKQKLTIYLAQMQIMRPNEIRLNFKEVPFDNILTWLASLWEYHGVDVQTFNASKQTTAGLVQIDMTLFRP